jgi:phage anti-repressor protein
LKQLKERNNAGTIEKIDFKKLRKRTVNAYRAMRSKWAIVIDDKRNLARVNRRQNGQQDAHRSKRLLRIAGRFRATG